MPSPRASSKNTPSGKRPAAGGTGRTGGAVSSRSGSAAKPAAAPEPAPAPAPVPKPAPVVPKETVSLIDDGKPAAAPAKPRAMRALPTIGKKPAPAPPTPVAPVLKPAAPAVPAPVVVDLISMRATSRSPRTSAPEASTPAAALMPPSAPTASADATSTVAPSVSIPTVEGETPAEKVLHIKPPILVRELAAHLGLKPFQLNKDLIAMNIFPSPNQVLEQEIVQTLCKKHGFTLEVERRERGGGVHKVEAVVKAPVAPVVVAEDELKPRAPIIVFMGHVDHGKTSLMDAIRKTRVAKGEAGGITQHIGAYSVTYQGHPITFLDTPGHAAFTAMRARGARVTDIAVIVIAADDGLMPQTLEAINHAKAAKVAIMVAINKIDVPGANIDRVKQQLQGQGLAPDDWGGDTTVCLVSATKGTGIDHLLELINLQAELMELKASPTAPPRGTVIEAQLEAGRGPTATLIVQSGTLKAGDAFICGEFNGKVKAMFDDLSKPLKQAGPSTPVRVVGFSGLPNSGDEFLVMGNEKDAKTLGEERQEIARKRKLATPQRATLESLFQRGDDGHKTLKLIVKADVQGSLEAIRTSLEQINSKKVDVDFVHTAIGPITDNDVLLASAANAVIIGFNTKLENKALDSAKREDVQVKLYSIIYELIDQVKEAMAGLLDPELRETVIGHAEVRQVFELTRGNVAGCMVTDGRIARTARARVLRRRQAVYDGGLATLRRFTEDVKEVRNGLECGIKLGDYSDYKVEDIIECYTLEKIAQKL